MFRSIHIIQPIPLNRSAALLAVLFQTFVGVMLAAECPPSNFSDVASHVILSDVVVEGNLTEPPSEAAATGLDSNVWKAEFAVDLVHKGDLFGDSAGMVSALLTNELLNCAGTMKVNRRYIVFLRGDGGVTSFQGRDFFYWASSPPTASTAKRIQIVKKYSCKTCGERETQKRVVDSNIIDQITDLVLRYLNWRDL